MEPRERGCAPGALRPYVRTLRNSAASLRRPANLAGCLRGSSGGRAAELTPSAHGARLRKPSRLSSFRPTQHPGLSSFSSLLSSSAVVTAAGAAAVRVRGWRAVSFILQDLFWPIASRAYLPLARSSVRSFVRSSTQSRVHRPAGLPVCLPACKLAEARQWQLYHVTSTLPHLKKANCIERRRRPLRHPSLACSASFGSRLSASPLWMNVHSIGGPAGGAAPWLLLLPLPR